MSTPPAVAGNWRQDRKKETSLTRAHSQLARQQVLSKYGMYCSEGAAKYDILLVSRHILHEAVAPEKVAAKDRQNSSGPAWP